MIALFYTFGEGDAEFLFALGNPNIIANTPIIPANMG